MQPAKHFHQSLLLLTALSLTCAAADANPQNQPTNGDIRLIVRADDIGSSHTANLACIESYRNGIARSVEVMVPCPWFNEAVSLLNQNPGLDAGVHLTLTSEWSNIKWRPLTHCPSLTDEQGNFYPMVWPNKNLGPDSSLLESKPKIEEVEREFRAQIELALKKIKNISHLTGHMGCTGVNAEIRQLTQKLAAEYNLPITLPNAKRPGGFGGSKTTPRQKEDVLLKMLENLKPGLWLFVDHPGLDTPEMRAIGHPGYQHVAADRDGVTRAFTSEKVKEIIKKRKIKLISYEEALKK